MGPKIRDPGHWNEDLGQRPKDAGTKRPKTQSENLLSSQKPKNYDSNELNQISYK